MLAIAALDPAAWAPARTWILAFVVARSAFAAWAAATRATFATGRHRRPARLGASGRRSSRSSSRLVVLASIGLPRSGGRGGARRRSSTSCSTDPVAARRPARDAQPARLLRAAVLRRIERPRHAAPRVPWRPVVSGIDLTAPAPPGSPGPGPTTGCVAATGSAALARGAGAGRVGGRVRRAGGSGRAAARHRTTSVESFAPGEPPPAESDAPQPAPPDATPMSSSSAPSAAGFAVPGAVGVSVGVSVVRAGPDDLADRARGCADRPAGHSSGARTQRSTSRS